MMFGFLGSSTVMKADQDVSPDSELAVQVYMPVSEAARSEERERGKHECQWMMRVVNKKAFVRHQPHPWLNNPSLDSLKASLMLKLCSLEILQA